MGWWRFGGDRFAAFFGGVLLVFFLVAVTAQWITPYDPYAVDLRNAFSPPSLTHPFGTDQFGRDVASRTILATRVTTRITASALLMALATGIPLGMLAGYVGGKAEALVMRATDILLIFPPILLAITVMAVTGPSEDGVIGALGLYAMPQFIRIARSATLAVKRELYVEASAALGASRMRILLWDVWPNISAPLSVQATLMFPALVLSASALSFLGLGVQPPTPEWGAMLNEARNFLRHAPHLVLGPGTALLLFVLASNLVGDSIQQTLSPRAMK